MKIEKTNALRLLDEANIKYEINTYDENITNGNLIASILNEDPNEVFKTLVTINNNKEYFVFCIPANTTLNLKKAALVTSSKYIEMIKDKDLLSVTSYIHGGCSPIGMKKRFKTYIDETCILYNHIYISGGRRGLQIKIDPNDLINYLNITPYDLTN